MYKTSVRGQGTIDIDGNLTSLNAKLDKTFNRARTIHVHMDHSSVNKAVAPLGKINSLASDFEKSMGAANARVIAFGASVALIAGVASTFKNLVSVVVNVEQKLADINSVFGLSGKALSGFSSGLFKVAKQTASSFDEAAKSALEFSRQGKSVEQTLKSVKDALILSRLTSLSQSDATQKLTAITNAYKGSVDDTTVVINKLRAVEASYAVDAGDLANAMQRSASIASEVGVSFDQLSGIVTAVQEKTARGGNVIGNAFKTIFTRISSADTLEYLENIGVKVKDMNGELLPAVGILKDVAKQMKDMSKIQRIAVLDKLAGKYNINSLSALMDDFNSGNSGVFDSAVKKSENQGNAAVLANDALNRTAESMFKNLITSIKELGVEMGKLGMVDMIKQVLSELQLAVNAIANLVKYSDTFQGILKGIGSLTMPLITVGLLAAIKSLSTFAMFAKDSAASYLGLNTKIQQTANLQRLIAGELATNVGLQDQLNKNVLTQAQAEKQVLSTLQAKLALTEKINLLAKSAATTAFGAGFRISKDDQLKRKGFVSDGFANGNLGKSPVNLRAIARESRISNTPPIGAPVNLNRDKDFQVRAGMAGFNKGPVAAYDKQLAASVNKEVNALKDKLAINAMTVGQADKELRALKTQFGFSASALGKFRKDLNQYGNVRSAQNSSRAGDAMTSFVRKANAYYDQGLITKAQKDAKIEKKAQFLSNSHGKDFTNAAHRENNSMQLARMQPMYGPNLPPESKSSAMVAAMRGGIGSAWGGVKGTMSGENRVGQALNGKTGMLLGIGAPMLGGYISQQVSARDSNGDIKSRSEMTGMERLKSNAPKDILGFAGMGLMVAGPWGALAGASVGLTKSFMSMGDTLQDLRERSDKLYDKEVQKAKGLDEFISELKKTGDSGGLFTQSKLSELSSKFPIDKDYNNELKKMIDMPGDGVIRDLERLSLRTTQNAETKKLFGVDVARGQMQSGVMNWVDNAKLRDVQKAQMSDLLSQKDSQGNMVFSAEEILKENESLFNNLQGIRKSEASGYGSKGDVKDLELNKKGGIITRGDFMKLAAGADETKIGKEGEQWYRSMFDQLSKGGEVASYKELAKIAQENITIAKEQIANRKVIEALLKSIDFNTGKAQFDKKAGESTFEATANLFSLGHKKKFASLIDDVLEPIMAATDNRTLGVSRDFDRAKLEIASAKEELKLDSIKTVSSISGNEIFGNLFGPEKSKRIRESSGDFSTEDSLNFIKSTIRELDSFGKVLSGAEQAFRQDLLMQEYRIQNEGRVIEAMLEEASVRSRLNFGMAEINKSFDSLKTKLEFLSSQNQRDNSLRSVKNDLIDTRASIKSRNFFGTTEQVGSLNFENAKDSIKRKDELVFDSAISSFNLEMQKSAVQKSNTEAIKNLTKAVLESILIEREKDALEKSRKLDSFDSRNGYINGVDPLADIKNDLNFDSMFSKASKTKFNNGFKDPGETFRNIIEYNKAKEREVAVTEKAISESKLKEAEAALRGFNEQDFKSKLDFDVKSRFNSDYVGTNITDKYNIGRDELINAGKQYATGNFTGEKFPDIQLKNGTIGEILTGTTIQQGADLESFGRIMSIIGERLLESSGEFGVAVQDMKEAQEWISISMKNRHYAAQNDFDYASVDPMATRLEKVNAEIALRKTGNKGADGEIVGASAYGTYDDGKQLFGAEVFDQVQNFKFEMAQNIPRLFRDNMSEAFTSMITGASTVKDALLNAAISFTTELNKAYMGKLMNGVMMGLGFDGTSPQKHARGGKVTGGSGNKDDVPALLMGGEYVIKKSSVNKYGEDFLSKLNSGTIGQRAGGGFVSDFGGYMATGVATNVLSSLMSKDEPVDKEYLEQKAWAKKSIAKNGIQSGPDYFMVGSKLANGKDAGVMKGGKAMLKFAQQEATSGSLDQFYRIGTGYGASLEDESAKLGIKARMGLIDGTRIAEEVSGAKEQAFGTYANYKVQLAEWKKAEDERKSALKRQIITSAIMAAVSAGAGNMMAGANSSSGVLNAQPIDAIAINQTTLQNLSPLQTVFSRTFGGISNAFSGMFGGKSSAQSASSSIMGTGTGNGVNSNSNGWTSPITPISNEGLPDWSEGNFGNPTYPDGKVPEGDLPMLLPDKTTSKYQNNQRPTLNRNPTFDYSTRFGMMNAQMIAAGGMVNGGSGSKDDVNTLLMGGEYVLSRNAVQKYGKPFIDSINKGTARMAGGGVVGEQMVQPTPTSSQSSSGTQNIEFNLTFNIEKGEKTSEKEDSSGNARDKEREMMKRVKDVVYGVIQEESRLGGLLT